MIMDASALLAYLLNEPGAERTFRAIAEGSFMTTVNFAEVASLYVRRGESEGYVRSLRARLPIRLIPVDEDIALRSALMIRVTNLRGLSLGDRGCLAAAQVHKIPALTANRAWAGIGADLDVEVELVR